MQVIRQVIGTSQQGDTVEVGLYIESTSEDVHRDGDSSRQSSPTFSDEAPLRCNFLITHQFSGGEPQSCDLTVGGGAISDTDVPRPQPAFDTLILRRLLRHIGGSLSEDGSSRNSPQSRSYEMTIVLGSGNPSVVNPSFAMSSEDAAILGYPDMRIANEPSLEELLQFAETLRGKSVTLHASSKGLFAHHLSSYLTAWGMDVSHMSTEPDADGEYELVGEVSESSAPPLPVLDLPTPSVSDSPPSTSPTSSRRKGAEPTFILIDDDVGVLRSRLQKIKAEQVYPLHLQGRKRPSLASHHRPRSSPQVARVMGTSSTNASHPGSESEDQ